jgi:hypothetical protein
VGSALTEFKKQKRTPAEYNLAKSTSPCNEKDQHQTTSYLLKLLYFSNCTAIEKSLFTKKNPKKTKWRSSLEKRRTLEATMINILQRIGA